jgi:hypothetical protein
MNQIIAKNLCIKSDKNIIFIIRVKVEAGQTKYSTSINLKFLHHKIEQKIKKNYFVLPHKMGIYQH